MAGTSQEELMRRLMDLEQKDRERSFEFEDYKRRSSQQIADLSEDRAMLRRQLAQTNGGMSSGQVQDDNWESVYEFPSEGDDEKVTVDPRTLDSIVKKRIEDQKVAERQAQEEAQRKHHENANWMAKKLQVDVPNELNDPTFCHIFQTSLQASFQLSPNMPVEERYNRVLAHTKQTCGGLQNLYAQQQEQQAAADEPPFDPLRHGPQNHGQHQPHPSTGHPMNQKYSQQGVSNNPYPQSSGQFTSRTPQPQQPLHQQPTLEQRATSSFQDRVAARRAKLMPGNLAPQP